MTILASFLAARSWACLPAPLEAWANARDSLGHLVQAGMSPIQKFENAIDGKSTLPMAIKDGVCTIDVQGILLLNAPWWAKAYEDCTDYGDLRAALDQAATAADVREVVLRFDSPGGDACGLAGTAAAIANVRQAGKPVHAQVAGCCASAAYYLAAACDQIMAEPDAVVGSIGVYAVLADTTGMQEKIGLKLVLVSSGGVKGAGADGKVTDAGKAAMQTHIDAMAAGFRAHVAATRKLDAARLAAVATGEYWMAPAALAAGLVDVVGVGSPILSSSASRTPTASAATTPESTVLTAQTLAALYAANPNHAAAISAEAQKPDATEASIKAAISAAETKAMVEAKAKADADLVAERAAHTTTKAELTELKAKHERLAALVPGYTDPGPSAKDGKTMAMADYLKLTPLAQAQFLEAGGNPA